MEERCNFFAVQAIKDPNWAFSYIIKFLQFQKERVQREEITGANLRNFVKSIKLFCEMSDIPITWKKITRGLPKMRRHADDTAPTLEEIQKICEYPDRRMKGLIYTMASSGIRLVICHRRNRLRKQAVLRVIFCVFPILLEQIRR